MFFNKPSYKKEKVNGFEEGYKFKTVTSIGLTLETNVGGWESLEASKEDRVLIVKQGLGFAKIQGRNYRLEEDVVLEIPSGTEVEMNGQLKFICITAKN